MNYARLVPEDSFLGRWMKRQSRLETAQQYDFWTGMWAISFVVGRSAYVDRGSIPVRLNLFCILVSESGVGRKSTAISQAEQLVDEMSLTSPTLLTGYTTAGQFDAVLEDMTLKGGSAQVGIAISEMARFLGRQSGMKDLPVFLTDLYDCPAKRVIFGAKSHKKQGAVQIIEVRNAWVSLLTGCTPVWLASAVHPQVLEGGFSSRTLFITAQRGKDPNPWPETIEDTEERKQLHDDLYKMRDTALIDGKIHLSDGAKSEYTTWYTHRKGAKSHYARIFESREPDHVLRCAAILCINDGGWEIQRIHISTAIKLIENVKHSLSELFVEGTKEESRVLRGIERVRETLSTLRPEMITHRDLSVKVRNYFSVEQFRTLMTTMHAMGLVEVVRQKNKKTTFYRGLTALSAPGHLQELARVVQRHHGS